MKKKRWSESDQAFGLLFAGIFLFLFGRVYWQQGIYSYLYGALSTLFLLISFTYPRALSPLKFLWMKFGEVVGRIITPIIMGFLFFVPVSGLALLMKLFGAKYMPLSFDKDGSYWVTRNKNSNQDFSKQF